MVFYDNYGRPTAYTEDDIHIYLFTGEPVAYIDRDAVYGYNGRQFGWFQNGWIRDLNGCCVFFSESFNISKIFVPWNLISEKTNFSLTLSLPHPRERNKNIHFH